MSLADEYKRQARWRNWEPVLRLLPLRAGERVLDIGCALGDQSAMLAARGAQVVGVDANAELLAQADRRAIPGASFVQADAADVSGLGLDPIHGPALLALLEEGDHQVVLGGEMPIERRLRHAGAFNDLIDSDVANSWAYLLRFL